MQIFLRLFPETPIRLDFSYFPKLAAAVYQAIAHADSDFADDLHGGELYRNRIKLFGFSPLYSRQTEIHPENRSQNKSGGLVFKGICSLAICSPWPELINRLNDGFIKTSQLRIGSQLLHIQKAIHAPVPGFKKTMVWRLRQPASCVTSWSSKDENKKRYALPGTPVDGHTCESLLAHNLIHKWRRLKEIRPDIAAAWLQTGAKENKEDVDFTEYSLRISLTRSQTILAVVLPALQCFFPPLKIKVFRLCRLWYHLRIRLC
jgi:CRISPR/Cas system endoribonuclease Cas6 (RAMP superfamily)